MNIQLITPSNPLWLKTLEKLHHDIYYLPEYFYVEAKRNQAIPQAILMIEDEKIFFLPYLVRNCNDLFDVDSEVAEFVDVVSPNGYAGILLSESAASTPKFLQVAMNELKSTLAAKQVCSAFFRLHPILNQDFNQVFSPDISQVNGETVSIDLTLSKAEIWHETRRDHRNKINWCKRAGLTARMVPFGDYINEFVEIYTETMNRVGAKQSFYFDRDYFSGLLDLGDKIHLCIVEWEGEITSAGLFTESCGIVQFHLSGTKNKFLKQAPSKLMLDYVRFWAKERGNKVFHLGGGVGAAKDSLYEFKAGFSKRRHPFLTLRLIVDKEKYRYLVELRAKTLSTKPEVLLESNYFPAYRSLT